MIEIYLLMLLVAVMPLAAARSPKRRARSTRRSRPWVVWNVRQSISLSTLANNTALEGTLLDNADDMYVHSALGTWSYSGFTAGEGPVDIGFLDNAYSVTEIVEAIDASPVDRSDKIASERNRRDVRNAGSIPGQDTSGSLRDGVPIHTKLRLRVSATSSLGIYVVNRSGSPRTTGAVVAFTGRLFGYWL